MKRKTREWVGKAEGDYRAARKLAKGTEALYDQTCFFCQQSAEKYLKALMEEVSLTIPKTHELDDLLGALTPHHSSLRSVRRGLLFLTNFAVAIRYPGDNASKRQAVAALRWAGNVRTAARTLLGLPLRKSRRKP